MRPGRVRWAFALLLVVAGAAFPSLASSKAKPPPTAPCAELSRTAMAKLVQTGPLAPVEIVDPYCLFRGRHPKHYVPTFEIGILPYSRSVGQATLNHVKHAQFHGASGNLAFVVEDLTDSRLPPCGAGSGRPGDGLTSDPTCSPEPPAVAFNVYRNGIDRLNGKHVIVTAGLTVQAGDVHLYRLYQLVKEVLSGQIH